MQLPVSRNHLLALTLLLFCALVKFATQRGAVTTMSSIYVQCDSTSFLDCHGETNGASKPGRDAILVPNGTLGWDRACISLDPKPAPAASPGARNGWNFGATDVPNNNGTDCVILCGGLWNRSGLVVQSLGAVAGRRVGRGYFEVDDSKRNMEKAHDIVIRGESFWA